MQTLDAKQNFSSEDPVWVLLAELWLRDFLNGPTAGSLFQTLRELGISPECMENIVGTLAGYAREALARINHGRLEFPGRIRIFCQKKMIDDANSAKTLRPYHTEQDEQQKQMFPDARANTIGGWGYFMIERGEDLAPYSSAILHNYIDLYLYKEGE